MLRKKPYRILPGDHKFAKNLNKLKNCNMSKSGLEFSEIKDPFHDDLLFTRSFFSKIVNCETDVHK
jgi:hypothetical protein